MNHIYNSLKKRGLKTTADNMVEEEKQVQISAEVLKANKPKLTAFANKLSATSKPEFKDHAKKILEIVDEA